MQNKIRKAKCSIETLMEDETNFMKVRNLRLRYCKTAQLSKFFPHIRYFLKHWFFVLLDFISLHD